MFLPIPGKYRYNYHVKNLKLIVLKIGLILCLFWYKDIVVRDTLVVNIKIIIVSKLYPFKYGMFSRLMNIIIDPYVYPLRYFCVHLFTYFVNQMVPKAVTTLK